MKPPKHKHHWRPEVHEMAEGWSILPVCRECGLFGSPDDAKLSDLLLQLVQVSVRVRPRRTP